MITYSCITPTAQMSRTRYYLRAGLKPMEPMQLHWAPPLWVPRAMLFVQVVHFCQILLALENCRNGF